jgi:hypothetical protein
MSTEEPHTIPRIAIQGIATGLFMMAFFTMIWALIGHFGLHGRDYNIEIIIFGALAIAFVINGAYLFSIAKRFPKLSSGEDIAESKKSSKWFGIIFGAEGLGIFIAVNIVTNIGHADLVIPVIALVVGLHFYPLAWLFKRTLDYYLATWSTLVAICGMVFTLNKTFTENQVFAFVGIGLAIATSCYGLYMMYNGRRLSL